MFIISVLTSCITLNMILISQCSTTVSPVIGSGSYLIQAGFVQVIPSNITTDFQSNSVTAGTISYTLNLNYVLTNFKSMFGLKQVSWYYDNPSVAQSMGIVGSGSSSNITIFFFAMYGVTLFQIQASYLAIDSSLITNLCVSSSAFVIAMSPGASMPANTSYPNTYNIPFAGYINQTKALLYCYYFAFNPALVDAHQMFGMYIELNYVVSGGPNYKATHPLGWDGDTRLDANLLYFNPNALFNQNIIVNYDTFSIGDKITLQSASNTLLYTYTYTAGTGCDLFSNNTFVGLAPYFLTFTQFNYKLQLTGNSIFVTGQNFYVYNYSLFSFCSMICASLANPFLYRPNFLCYDICPDGYYGNLTTTFCQLCQVNCSTCNQAEINCTSCVNSTFLFNFTCVLTCPNQTYGNASLNQCLSCTGTCQNCDFKSTNCTTCINNTYFLNFTCYYNCPLGYYEDDGTKLCIACQASCINCSSLIQCFSCQNGSFLYNFTCVLTCPNQTYGNVSVNQCLNCTGTCLNRETSSSNCTTCINGTFYLNYKCYFICPNKYYGNYSTQLCQSCQSNCLTCTSSSICTKCVNNYYLSPNSDSCLTSCPPYYFPNTTSGHCQLVVLPGCATALYINGTTVCLQCNISLKFQYIPKSRTCVCKSGYKLKNGICEQICGDGIVFNNACDDGNLISGDGCSFVCSIQNNFQCISVLKETTFTSKCTYLPDINIQILSQTKVQNQNTLKLILKIHPTPYLTANDIRKFLNMKIANQTIDLSKVDIDYKDGIVQIYVPFNSDIQDESMNLWTNFDPTKFSSENVNITKKLKGDNIALLYSSSLILYKALATFNFSMAVFVCIFAFLSFYKHKMIGLQLIMPFQIILYSQSFYNLKALQSSLYTAFKPVSYSIFKPDQIQSKNNSWYKIGMTGGFLENYNFLGVFFLIATILMIFSMFGLQNGQKNRFKNKKAMKDWLNFGQFKIIIQKYQTIIWKCYYVSFCLSMIPLIFSVSAKAMTDLSSVQSLTLIDVINNKCNYLFVLLFMGALFYTSIPRIFYNNKKSLLKKHIFKQQGKKFRYDANYCVYFLIHYLIIALIYAYFPSTQPVFYALSVVNGIFFCYLIVKRPYDLVIDNIGAILSNLIVLYFLSLNFYIKISDSSSFAKQLSKYSGFVIMGLLVIETILALFRLIIFWAYDKLQEDLLNGLSNDEKIVKFKYNRDVAFNNFINTDQTSQQEQFKNKTKKQTEKIFVDHKRTIQDELLNKAEKIRSNSDRKKSIIDEITSEKKKQSPEKNQQLQKINKKLKQSFKKYQVQQNEQQRGNLYENSR